jgi:hypothetical protein
LYLSIYTFVSVILFAISTNRRVYIYIYIHTHTHISRIMSSTFRSGSAPGSSRQKKLYNSNDLYNNNNNNNNNTNKSSKKKKKIPNYRPSITRVGNSGGGSNYSQLADLNAALRNSFSIQDESSYKLDMNHFTTIIIIIIVHLPDVVNFQIVIKVIS